MLNHMFRSLAGRDFRLYFIGQVISLIGTWVQQVALSWIAYRVTGSAFMLGLVAFSGQIPMLLLTPFGGGLADRFKRRSILLLTQVIEMAVAATLAMVAWQGEFTAPILIAASLVLGVCGAIEMPTRQAFIMDILHDRQHMTNAIALHSLTFNGARLVGPALAGVLLAAAGEVACFMINALSYIAAIYTLLAIHPRQAALHRSKGSLRESLAYVRDFPPARWLLGMVALTSFCVAPFMTFMPVYAKDIFHGGPDTLGTLMGASGFGALLAALYLANQRSITGLGMHIVAACVAAGSASAAFAYNPLLTLALPLLIVTGSATIIIVTSCNMVLQSLVSDHLRGRVMAFYTMSFIGVMPLGSLADGWLAHRIGVQPVFLLAGGMALIMGYAFWRKLPYLLREAHPVLSEKGLLSNPMHKD
jgi:MFS family permease